MAESATERVAAVLAGAARGRFPPADGGVTVLPQPSARDAGVLGFTAHAVVFADVDPDWVRGQLPDGDLGAPLRPPFLSALCAKTGRIAGDTDLLCFAEPLAGEPPLTLTRLDLVAGLGPAGRPGQDQQPGSGEPPEPAQRTAGGGPGENGAGDGGAGDAPGASSGRHPRIERAFSYRDEVRAWAADGGVVLIGRGVAGRWETAIEVDPERRGNGLGRALATAARHLVPADEALWAQVAPANAASVRAFLAAGFTPVGAEILLAAGPRAH